MGEYLSYANALRISWAAKNAVGSSEAKLVDEDTSLHSVGLLKSYRTCTPVLDMPWVVFAAGYRAPLPCGILKLQGWSLHPRVSKVLFIFCFLLGRHVPLGHVLKCSPSFLEVSGFYFSEKHTLLHAFLIGYFSLLIFSISIEQVTYQLTV